MSTRFFSRRAVLLIFSFIFSNLLLGQQSPENDPLLMDLRQELYRNAQVYKETENSAYLISYRVEEIKEYMIRSVFGNLVQSDSSLKRILTIQVRVGDYSLDNYHELRDDASDYFSYQSQIYLPIENDSKGISQIIWRETDIAYREAVKRYEKVKANVAVKVEADDKALDFSDTEVEKYYEPALNVQAYNQQEWIDRLNKYTGAFIDEKEILDATAMLRIAIHRKYYLNSEGTEIVENQPYTHLYISSLVQADDGMSLPLGNSYFAHLPGDLPHDEEMMKEIVNLKETILKLKVAPIVDSYTGPALLTNEAAGVFFHEIFGHRVEGQRMKSESDGQTFKKKLGEQILNTDISVIFDPTIRYYKDIPLNGSYVFDDEGVRGQRVEIVKDGVLKNFLMTRTPIDNFPQSNGHARAQAGYQPVSRQSNLIVETTKPYTDEQLRQMLIEEAQAQGKEYGYLFHKVQGGFTMTGRYYPNSFNVTPTEVYRVYVDGREDELVRGVDLVGTPLAMFSQIEGVGNMPGNFAGTCGAESGGVPAGCCSPALFVKRIEMQKKSKEQSRPPIAERPYDEKLDGFSFQSVVFDALKDEIDNNLKELSIEGLQSPYYISYLVTDANLMAVESTLGGVTHILSKPVKDFEAEVLVGNHKRNNMNFIDENTLFSSRGGRKIAMPVDGNYNGIRTSLWYSTDREYKSSAEMMEAKNLAIQQQNRPDEETQLPDKADIAIQTYEYDLVREHYMLSDMENLSIQLSRAFLDYPNITNSGADVYSYQANAYYLNSEGVRYVQPFQLFCLRVFAETLSDDGEELMNYFTVYSHDFNELPAFETLLSKTLNLANTLEQIRTAPILDEAYSGPVMFIGEAVGEIFASAFVEANNSLLAGRKNVISNPDLLRWYGQYLPKENTIENMKGKKVVSRDLTINALAEKDYFQGIPLIGSYKVDAEGVEPNAKLSLIDDGVLQNLLTDRIPTNAFRESNGHKRLALSGGKLTTSLAPGVLELTGKSKMSYQKMKKKLIALAKEEDYEYAYIVTKMLSPTANVAGREKYMTRENYYYPIAIIRVNVKDGSETFVRMAKVSALNMKAFKQVVAVSNQQQVYNTMVRGKNRRSIWSPASFNLSGVPASFILPTAILFKELDVEKDQSTILRKQPRVSNPLKTEN